MVKRKPYGAEHRVQRGGKSVSTRDYNYREATAEMTTGQHDATGGDNTTYGEAYHYADNFLQQGDKEAAESGAFYARIRHERYLNEQAILKGQSTSSLLMPGLEIKFRATTRLRCSARAC